MLLRRVIEHVKAQNWTAVALDFVIVVVGVFIGIQVANWNEARILSGEERLYLERLHWDLARSAENAEANANFQSRQAELEAAILQHLSRCEWTDEARRDLVTGAYLVGKLSIPSLRRGVIDELLSSGKLSLIRNEDIRFALADLVRTLDGDAGVLDQIVTRLAPHIAYVEARIVFDLPNGGIANTPETVVSPERAQVDYDALCSDDRYAAALSTIRHHTLKMVRTEMDYLERFHRVIAAIEAELGYTPAIDIEEALY